MTPAEEKRELRRQAATLSKVQADHLLRRFADLPQVSEAATVLVFYGVGTEPDTRPLITALLARGQRVALPVCLPGRAMEARLVDDLSQLVPGTLNIPEPDGRCPAVPPVEIGAVLVPCLMCDRLGYRLGHGGGYYDRWLAGYGGFTACVCPAERLLTALPREAFDRPVSLVLTDTESGRRSCLPRPK